VAGAFYPDDAAELASMVDGFLAKAEPAPLQNLRGMVCPHAGFVYSGPTAAYCYKLLQGLTVDHVAILAPSHRVAFVGVSIPEVDAYRTPLGLVLVSEQVKHFANQGPFIYNPQAHAQEHSLEVQLPFLQRVLQGTKIIPMVFGEANVAEVARRLGQHLGPKSIVVASSDLSHYHPYEVAQRLDRSAIDAILSLDVEGLRDQEVCGKWPVAALMLLAKQKGRKATLLDYRNSGDTAGSKAQVVGYAAIAFYRPEPEQAQGG
jgi:AmmeMemoRadiSam system protein B